MPNDPLAMDDPSHPLHAMAQDFAAMRQRRQLHDQRQAMLAQQLAAPQQAPTMGGYAMPAAGAMPVQASPMAGVGGGLAGMAQMIKQMQAAQAVQPTTFNTAQTMPYAPGQQALQTAPVMADSGITIGRS